MRDSDIDALSADGAQESPPTYLCLDCGHRYDQHNSVVVPYGCVAVDWSSSDCVNGYQGKHPNSGWGLLTAEASAPAVPLTAEALDTAVHHSGMVLVDQVSGKVVEDGPEVLLRYLPTNLTLGSSRLVDARLPAAPACTCDSDPAYCHAHAAPVAPQPDEALRAAVEAVCDAYGDKGWAKSEMVRRLRAALAARGRND